MISAYVQSVIYSCKIRYRYRYRKTEFNSWEEVEVGNDTGNQEGELTTCPVSQERLHIYFEI